MRFDLSEEMLGVDFRAIQRIAVGPAVLSAVSEAIGLEEGPGELAERFDFDFLRDVSAISVTARASTAQEAHDLVQRWIEAIQDEVRRLMESEFELLETVAKENYERQVQALAESENALAAFDRDRSLDLLEAEYRHGVDQLAQDQAQLNHLETFVIGAEEARLRFLESALEQEPEFLETPGLLPYAGSERPGEVLHLNPVYLDLRQRWIEAQENLVTAREQVRRLRERIAQRRSELQQISAELSAAKLERERLQRQVAEALTQVQGALAELGEIRRLEPELARLSRVEITVAPTLPDSPVSPRLAFDLVIGAMLGLTLGVAAAIVAEWWRGHRVSMGRGRQEISIS